MAKDVSPPTDVYAVQKANIRDTVKYVAAAYTACGTIIFAGVSLSGLGSLPLCRLLTATGLGAIAFVCVLLAMKSIFGTLTGDFAFPSTLDQSAKDYVNQHQKDLIGDIAYDAFLKKVEDARAEVECIRVKWREAKTDADLKPIKEYYNLSVETLREYDTQLSRIVSFAHLYLLQQKLGKLQTKLGWLAVITVITLGLAVITVTKKSSQDSSICVQVKALAS